MQEERTSCHHPPWESLWIKQETLNQHMFLLVGWLCITATLPISKNGEVIWGINNSNCELTIQVNMEDVTQLTTEALHNFGLNYCSHSPGSSPTQHATGLESWSETQWKSPACHQRQNINVCICFRINYWFVTSTVVIWVCNYCFILTSWISTHH